MIFSNTPPTNAPTVDTDVKHDVVNKESDNNNQNEDGLNDIAKEMLKSMVKL